LNEDGAPFDSGFDDTGPFRVSPESGGVSLESALRDFGPAAIDDLIPRIRGLAETLDAAHRAGVVHGALHPSKVFVTDEATELVAGKGGHAPYAAPEVLEGHGATALSDQFSLAAIAYEWLFGRQITHNGERPIEVRSMPGVDRVALSKAFTRALAPKPDDRFASCSALCQALNGAVVPELPLLADLDEFAPGDAIAPAIVPPIDFLSNVDDVKIVAEESILMAAPFDSERADASLAQGRQPDLDTIDPRLSQPVADAVPAWHPAAAHPARTMETPRFGPIALFLAVIVGALFGFAAGYMARPRALQSAPPQEFAVTPGTDAEVKSAQGAQGAQSAQGAQGAQGAAPTAPEKAPAASAPRASSATRAPEKIGRLLVRSTPSGASVTVDGVARGVTPLALRDLDVGTRTVTVARRGYIPETLRVVITKARPSRTLDVRLATEAVASKPAGARGAPRPSTPASLGKTAASAGQLAIESRPIGAAVTINGKPRGTTPLTINDLAPGEYRIQMSMPGYRNFTTTVRVVAGERVRAAASLTALEQQ
jgi:hypothetical protein